MNTNTKIALALLDEVETKVNDYFGNTIAMPIMDDGYDAERDIFCKTMVEQCDLAEKKSTDAQVLLTSAILKAQCYGCWQKPFNSRGTHKNAKKYYERALELATTDEQKAEIYYRYALFARTSFMGNKQLSIENFEKAINYAGEESELGLICAAELEKTKQKKSGCFIATAVYGTPYAKEVVLLKEFRDNWLLNYYFGRIFVKFYYSISPTIANKISKSNILKVITKSTVIIPLIKVVKYFEKQKSN
jgi:tetratricopeptide (TPR) repeat protein